MTEKCPSFVLFQKHLNQGWAITAFSVVGVDIQKKSSNLKLPPTFHSNCSAEARYSKERMADTADIINGCVMA